MVRIKPIAIVSVLCLLALTACGRPGFFSPQANHTDHQVHPTSGQVTRVTTMEAPDYLASWDNPDQPREMKRSPYENRMAMPERGMPSNAPAYQASSNLEQRVERLEYALMEMKRDLGTIMPLAIRYMSEENNPSPYPMGNNSMRITPPPLHNNAQATSAPVQMSSSQPAPSLHAAKPTMHVKNVRFGEHGGMTRLVLDVMGDAPYTYDVDNGEHLLLVDLPHTEWQANMSDMVSKSPLVKSYSVQDNNGNKLLVVQLKKNAHVKKAFTLPGKMGMKRVVLDIGHG